MHHVNNDLNNNWPPAYTIRQSNRAKQVILQISKSKGLVVIVPAHRKNPKIEELLKEKRQWIQRNLSTVKIQAEQNTTPFAPPSSLLLHAIEKKIMFDYQKTEHKHIQIISVKKTNNPPEMMNNENLYNPVNFPNSFNSLSNSTNISELHYLILGPIDEPILLIKALKSFIKNLAQQYLIPWLNDLSSSIHLPYQTASIRSQSTLWGSCTAAKKISLNVKLLFLPKVLTQYVLLHELCHTQHLNHSKRYWDLLKRFDPHCLAHRRMLRTAGQYLPHWIEMPE